MSIQKTRGLPGGKRVNETLKLLLTGGALCAIVAASPAMAQQSDTDGASQEGPRVLNEIVVTAQKREESLQSVPIAITAITGEDLERTFALDLTDVTGGIPNATIETDGISNLAASFFIRGQGITSRESFSDSPVAVVVNGVTQGRTTTVLTDFLDVQSVEVLRGPQGTLQGRNSTAGAVLVRTNAPNLNDFGGNASLTVGEHNRLDATAVMNIPIAEGVAAFRVAAKSTNFDGFYTNLFNGQRVGGQDRFTILPSLRIASGPFEAIIRGEYSRIRDDSVSILNFNSCGVDPRIPANANSPLLSLFTRRVLAANGPDAALFTCASEEAANRRVVNENRSDGASFNVDSWGITAELNYEIADFGTITYIGDYRESEEFSGIDADGTPLDLLFGPRTVPHEQQSHELRFASDFSDFVDFVAGVYYFDQEYTLVETNKFGFLAPTVLTLQSSNGQQADQFAVFGQANWNLTDRLTLITGARYTRESKDAFLCPTGFTPCADRTLGVVGQREEVSGTWSDISPRVGLNYELSDDLFAYGYWAQGFRSGGFNLLAPNAAQSGPFDPEKVNTFEVGLKADLFDRRVRFNTSLFLNEASDLQRTVLRPNALGSPATTTANAASATFWGAEFELTALVTDNLTWNASVGYLNASYDEFCEDLNGTAPNDPGLENCAPAQTVTGGVLQPVDLSSLPLQRTPKWDIRNGVVYDFDLGNTGTLSLAGDWTYTSRMSTLSTGLPTGLITGITQFDGYVISTFRDATNIFNVSATYRDADERFRVSAFVRNLTNETYISRVSAVTGLFNFINLNDPQTWGVELGVNF